MTLIVFAVLAIAGTATAQDAAPNPRQTRVPDFIHVLHMYDTTTETPWTVNDATINGDYAGVYNVFYNRSKTDKRFNDYPCGSVGPDYSMVGTCGLTANHREERQTFLDTFYYLPEPPQADREISYNAYAIADELPYTVIVDRMIDQSRPDIITVMRGTSEIDDRFDGYACEEADAGYPPLFLQYCQISMAQHPDNLIRFLDEFYYLPEVLSETTVEAQGNTPDGKETYIWAIPNGGVATFQYPSGWFVQESGDAIIIATSQAVVNASGLGEGDVFIAFRVAHITKQLASGLSPASTARDWLPFLTKPYIEQDWNFEVPSDLTIEAYSATQVAGSSDIGDMTITVVNMGNGRYSIIAAISVQGEMSMFDTIVQAILASVIYS
jgi:hypothetical protein